MLINKQIEDVAKTFNQTKAPMYWYIEEASKRVDLGMEFREILACLLVVDEGVRDKPYFLDTGEAVIGIGHSMIEADQAKLDDTGSLTSQKILRFF